MLDTLKAYSLIEVGGKLKKGDRDTREDSEKGSKDIIIRRVQDKR